MWEILGALLIGTAVSGIVPIVNAELLVAAAAVAVPAVGLPEARGLKRSLEGGTP